MRASLDGDGYVDECGELLWGGTGGRLAVARRRILGGGGGGGGGGSGFVTRVRAPAHGHPPPREGVMRFVLDELS
jgi:hypothetical protein